MAETLFKKVYGDIDENRSKRTQDAKVMQQCSPTIDVHQADVDNIERPENPVKAAVQIDMGENDDLSSRAIISNPFTIAAMNAKVSPTEMASMSSSASSDRIESLQRTNLEHHFDHQEEPRPHRTPLGQGLQLATPSASPSSPMPYQNPGPPMRRHNKSLANEAPEHDIDTRPQRRKQGQHITGNLMQTWLTPNTDERRPFEHVVHRRREASHESSDDTIPAASIPLLESSGAALSTTNPSSRFRWGPGQQPFRSPLKRSSNGEQRESPGRISHMSSFEPSVSGEVTPGVQHRTFREPTIGKSRSRSTELEDIMDFEHRKKAAIAQQRRLAAKFPSKSIGDILRTNRLESSASPLHDEEIPASTTKDMVDEDVLEQEDFAAKFSDAGPSTLPKTKASPHHNRYLAAIKHLSHSHTGTKKHSSNDEAAEHHEDANSTTPHPQDISSTISKDDPRAVLARQQHQRNGKSKIYRTKSSSKLPLETIHPDMMTLHLAQKIKFPSSTPYLINRLVQNLANRDRYIIDGTIETEDFADRSAAEMWKENIRELIKTKYRSEDGEDMRMRIDDIEILLPPGTD